MAVIALAYGVIGKGSLWYPVNLLSAVAMPSMARADVSELSAFSAAALLIGILAHAAISVLVGLLYAVILPMLPRRPLRGGGLVAPLWWRGLLSALPGVITPALGAGVDWNCFVASQTAFGIAAGIVVSRARRVPPAQTVAPPAAATDGSGRR